MGLAREARILTDRELFIVSDERGDLRRTFPGAGLYTRDTRFLSEFWFLLNGEEPELFDSAAEQTDTAIFQFGNTVFRDEANRDVLAHTISIRRCRKLQQGALIEEFVLENLNAFVVTLELALVFAADFLDIFDVRGFPRERPRGHVLLPQYAGQNLRLAYRAPDDVILETEILFNRAPDLATVEPGSTHLTDLALPRMLLPGHDLLVRAGGRIHPPRAFAMFRFTIPVHSQQHLTARVVPRELLERRTSIRVPDIARLHEPASTATIPFARVQTNNELLNRVLQRSLDDIRALVTPFPGGQLVAAGIPWFVAPFGRDSLIVSLQLILFSPELAIETLRYLSRYQGQKVDPWTEEEPGRILHELRFGEMVRLGEAPHSPYYGTVDATPLFLLTFCELMDWLGSPALLEEFLPAVDASLQWIDHYGDHNGDGFVDYSQSSTRGLVHQNWKDSHNSLLFPNGSEPVPPIAPVEVQGYVFQAKRALAAILQRYGSPEHQMLAAKIRADTERLRERFERSFWSETDQYYGQALDGQGRLVTAIFSNPGHCLWSAIVSPARARLVVQRLLGPDLYSGWGIRTLARSMPHYNPMSYHNGSIWPHDNALIIAGLRRYGFDREAIQLVTDLLEVAVRFPYYRLPELYCGFGRDEAECMVPISYPVSCSPQAWAAGTMPFLLRVLLGIEARAAERRLTLRPAFPPWLDEVELENISFAGRRLHFAVRRMGDRYLLEVESDPEITVTLAGVTPSERR